MYLLGYQAMVYVGSVVVAPPAGYLYDKIGFSHTFLMMGCCALLFTLISSFTLSSSRAGKKASTVRTDVLHPQTVKPSK